MPALLDSHVLCCMIEAARDPRMVLSWRAPPAPIRDTRHNASILRAQILHHRTAHGHIAPRPRRLDHLAYFA